MGSSRCVHETVVGWRSVVEGAKRPLRGAKRLQWSGSLQFTGYFALA